VNGNSSQIGIGLQLGFEQQMTPEMVLAQRQKEVETVYLVTAAQANSVVRGFVADNVRNGLLHIEEAEAIITEGADRVLCEKGPELVRWAVKYREAPFLAVLLQLHRSIRASVRTTLANWEPAGNLDGTTVHPVLTVAELLYPVIAGHARMAAQMHLNTVRKEGVQRHMHNDAEVGGWVAGVADMMHGSIGPGLINTCVLRRTETFETMVELFVDEMQAAAATQFQHLLHEQKHYTA
jgi:hypothetical protein